MLEESNFSMQYHNKLKENFPISDVKWFFEGFEIFRDSLRYKLNKTLWRSNSLSDLGLDIDEGQPNYDTQDQLIRNTTGIFARITVFSVISQSGNSSADISSVIGMHKVIFENSFSLCYF